MFKCLCSLLTMFLWLHIPPTTNALLGTTSRERLLLWGGGSETVRRYRSLAAFVTVYQESLCFSRTLGPISTKGNGELSSLKISQFIHQSHPEFRLMFLLQQIQLYLVSIDLRAFKYVMINECQYWFVSIPNENLPALIFSSILRWFPFSISTLIWSAYTIKPVLNWSVSLWPKNWHKFHNNDYLWQKNFLYLTKDFHPWVQQLLRSFIINGFWFVVNHSISAHKFEVILQREY